MTNYYMGTLPYVRDALTAVAAVSPSDVWATGVNLWAVKYVGYVPQALILHWDGRSWRAVQTPDLSPFAEIRDVAAVAPNNVWAVGSRLMQDGTGTYQLVPLLLHYDGTRWASVTPPKLASAAGLRGLTLLSERDIWAVGWLFNPARQAHMPLALHFDGTVWRQVDFPAVPGSSASLNRVAASGPAAVYAVGGGQQSVEEPVNESPGGTPVAARWDGHAWTLLPMTGIQPDAELRDVAVTGSDLWVVGDRADTAGPIEGLAWRSRPGGGWTSYRPDPHRRGVLNGVHTTSAREVWAAGTPGNDGTGDGLLLVRWDGQRWKVAFRIPAVAALRGLADVTTAGGRVFSVGGTTRTLAVQN